MHVQHIPALAARAALGAALALGLTGLVGTPASAATGCTGHTAVPEPGESSVPHPPTHRGGLQLRLTFLRESGATGRVAWEFRVTETNRTGAPYQHVTPGIGAFAYGPPAFFLSPKNTVIGWMKPGDGLVPLSTASGCDPAFGTDSAALDGPLADGQSKTFDLYLITSTANAVRLTDFHVYAGAYADGTYVMQHLTLPTSEILGAGPSPSPTPVHTPTSRPSEPVTSPDATATTAAPSSAAPSTASASAGPAALAHTGGGSDTLPLVVGGAALIAAGGALAFGVRRTGRRW
jgi:hypothetical protein